MSLPTNFSQAQSLLVEALIDVEKQDYFIKAPWRVTIALVKSIDDSNWYNTYIRLRHPHELEHELCMGWNRAYLETAYRDDLQQDAWKAADDVKAFIEAHS